MTERDIFHHNQILSLPLLPSSSLGKSPTGERGGMLFSFHSSPAFSPSSVHLCLPQPLLQHNNNLPICCNQTFPSSSPSSASSSSSAIPLFSCILSLLSLLPQSQPHHAFHLPHYPPHPPSSPYPHFPSPPPPCCRQNSYRPLLISLIGGVRMQFHLSSPLHSSVGHSITFRCSDADVAVLVVNDKEGGEGRDGANDEPPSSRSLTLFFLPVKTKSLFLRCLFSHFPYSVCVCFSFPRLCLIYPSESENLSLILLSSFHHRLFLTSFLLPTKNFHVSSWLGGEELF